MYLTGRYAEDYYEQIASEIEAGNLESLNQVIIHVVSTTHVCLYRTVPCNIQCNTCRTALKKKVIFFVLSIISNSNLNQQTLLKVTTVKFGHRDAHGTCEIASVYPQTRYMYIRVTNA